MRRYSSLFSEGEDIDVVEVALKDDAKDDPVVTGKILDQAGVLTGREFEKAIGLFYAK